MADTKGPGVGPGAAEGEPIRLNLIISKQADGYLYEFMRSRLGDVPKRLVASRFKSILWELLLDARMPGQAAGTAPVNALVPSSVGLTTTPVSDPGERTAGQSTPSETKKRSDFFQYSSQTPPSPPSADGTEKRRGYDMTQLDGVELPQF